VLNFIRLFLLDLLKGIDAKQHAKELTEVASNQFELGEEYGIVQGRKQVPTRFGVIALPFTDAQLAGHEYGDFITPNNGFSAVFGEQNIPAPGQHGYEQRAYYVERVKLDLSPNAHDLLCQTPRKFNDPANSYELVPVIVTVLR
jgi:hypothetical protein